MQIKLKQTDANVVKADLIMNGDETARFLLMSDIHIDSVYCDRDALMHDIKTAYNMGAWFIIAGDIFDAMQGKFDPRRNMDELRPEYRRDDYFDAVIDDTAEILSPYADRILVIGYGNHETSILRRNNTDLIARLTKRLNRINSPAIAGAAGYAGWIVLTPKSHEGNPHCRPLRLRYAHSAGGGNAPVTRGMISTNRQAVYLPDADVVLNGHNHEGYIAAISRLRLSNKGREIQTSMWFVRTPGYKRVFGSSRAKHGFDIEKLSPKPIGSVLMEVSADGRMQSKAERLKVNLTPWIR